ncbi:MAG: DUF2330 domain-containing protein [Alphaproteobacteria bacterium]|nr:DUF2330 domain-containing protein [Alphaproteobacteria bacterium]
MLLLALSLPAHGFCGTYVGPADATLRNHATQVIVARDAPWTTLTLAADVQGDAADFAVLIPVPASLGPEDVREADPGLFAVLDAWSAPREVAYSCPGDDSLGLGLTASDATGGAPVAGDAWGVTTEAAFATAHYALRLLDAEGAEGLMAWLDAEGFAVPPASAPVLAGEIEAGRRFLVGRLRLDAPPVAAATLPPLQLTLCEDAWSLPVQLGATVAAGQQELILYAITRPEVGRVGVVNLPERVVEDECMVPRGETAEGWYAAELDRAFAEGGGWLTEYAWSSGKCDPCAGEPPDPAVLAAAGATWADPFVTRLRVRLSPHEADQPLALYGGGGGWTDQIRYIQWDWAMEQSFPVCGGDPLVLPGSCEQAEALGCASAPTGAWWLLGLVALTGRRRGRLCER